MSWGCTSVGPCVWKVGSTYLFGRAKTLEGVAEANGWMSLPGHSPPKAGPEGPRPRRYPVSSTSPGNSSRATLSLSDLPFPQVGGYN